MLKHWSFFPTLQFREIRENVQITFHGMLCETSSLSFGSRVQLSEKTNSGEVICSAKESEDEKGFMFEFHFLRWKRSNIYSSLEMSQFS